MDPIDIDIPLVDAVLRLYPPRYRPRRVALPPDGAGFSGAIVLQVETENGNYCLRGWPVQSSPRPSHPVERIRGLHRWLSHIKTCGLDCVAVPVTAGDGTTLVSPGIETGGRWWQLEPWMAGRADYWSRPSAARLTAVGRVLARWRRAAATFEPNASEKVWFTSAETAVPFAVSERLQLLEGWTTSALAELEQRIEADRELGDAFRAVARRIARGFGRSAPAIAHELRTAERSPVPVQPVLRDVWHDHILFEGDEVSAIIDPSAARSDTVAADISRLFGSLNGDDRFGWNTALGAYQSVRPLSSAELTLVGVLDRSGVLLSGMTWLTRAYLTGRKLEQQPRVQERLERIAGRLNFVGYASA